jgi:hypothetical protein
MTHFTILVRFEGDIANAEKTVGEMLAPYDENKEVPKYKHYLRKEEVERACKHFGIKPMSPSGVAVGEKYRLTPAQIEEYFGNAGGEDKKGYFYWSTYNIRSGWDWYQIGGRWQGMLLLKAGAKGMSGTRSLLDKREPSLGVDVAYLKDVDWDAMRNAGGEPFTTHAVVDAKGWHEAAKMGWFAVTYNRKEKEETWDSLYAQRFLSNPTDTTVVAVVTAYLGDERTLIQRFRGTRGTEYERNQNLSVQAATIQRRQPVFIA